MICLEMRAYNESLVMRGKRDTIIIRFHHKGIKKELAIMNKGKEVNHTISILTN